MRENSLNTIYKGLEKIIRIFLIHVLLAIELNTEQDDGTNDHKIQQAILQEGEF